MSNTVLIKKAPISTSDSIFFLTITEPAYTFSCDYLNNSAYIWFNDDENIKLYKKLQIAEGMLKEDSNFVGILAKELRKRGQ